MIVVCAGCVLFSSLLFFTSKEPAGSGNFTSFNSVKSVQHEPSAMSSKTREKHQARRVLIQKKRDHTTVTSQKHHTVKPTRKPQRNIQPRGQ